MSQKLKYLEYDNNIDQIVSDISMGDQATQNTQNNNQYQRPLETRPKRFRRRRKMGSLKRKTVIILSIIGGVIALFMIFFLTYDKYVRIKLQKNQKFEYPPTVSFTEKYQNEYLYEKQPSFIDIQGKGSHNSYNIGEYPKQLKVDHSKPQDGSCINVEIDLILEQSGQPHVNNIINDYKYLVSHDEANEIESRTLDVVLQKIYKWHKANYNHFPIIVTLDLKDSDFYEEEVLPFQVPELVDYYIKKNFDVKKDLHTPQFYEKYENLYLGIQDLKWPLVEDLAGKIIFVISGSCQELNVNRAKQTYADNWKKSYAFVDIDSRIVSENVGLEQRLEHFRITYYDTVQDHLEENPNQIFYNQKLEPSSKKPTDQEEFLKNIKDAAFLNLFVRGWVSNDENSWNQYKQAGVNIITTDKVYDVCWTVMEKKYYNECLKKKKKN